MTTKMTEFAAHVYNDFTHDKKIRILLLVKGKAALDGIRKVLFADDTVEADKWQKKLKWSSRDISNSIFFIYERKLIKNTEKGCKFVIGERGKGSVLGQVLQ